MPNNKRIEGDDVPWKREVDLVISQLQDKILNLQSQIDYLKNRVK